MTESDLIELMAAEICYAGFIAGQDYGGSQAYWRGITEKKREQYRIQARAALSAYRNAVGELADK